MKTMKNNLTYILLFFVAFSSFSQSINNDKVSLANFIKRMYTTTPFEGVKVIDDYDKQYLLSVISLDKAKFSDPAIMNRVAQVKAQSQASTYLNGATISMDMVISTKDVKDSAHKVSTIVETIEHIKQNSMGFSQGLELLSNFENSDFKRIVYVYFRVIK
jgi:hypothetical protein